MEFKYSAALICRIRRSYRYLQIACGVRGNGKRAEQSPRSSGLTFPLPPDIIIRTESEKAGRIMAVPLPDGKGITYICGLTVLLTEYERVMV